MPSVNESYICLHILRQLLANDKIEPFPELTLDIANGITPDISVFPKDAIKPNLLHDSQMPRKTGVSHRGRLCQPDDSGDASESRTDDASGRQHGLDGRAA